ncbi:hypothetical protein ACOSP7_030966 [Xanthoceras sorbifolium]
MAEDLQNLIKANSTCKRARAEVESLGEIPRRAGSGSNKGMKGSGASRIETSVPDGNGNKATADNPNHMKGAGGNIRKNKPNNAGGSRFDVLSTNLEEAATDAQRKGKAHVHCEVVQNKVMKNSIRTLTDITNNNSTSIAPNHGGKKDMPKNNNTTVNRNSKEEESKQLLLWKPVKVIVWKKILMMLRFCYSFTEV